MKFVVGLFLIFSFSAQANPITVPDFALLDTNGTLHQLSKNKEKKLIALMTYGIGCPIARHALADFKDLQKEFRSEVNFYLLDSNIPDERQDLIKEVAEFNIQTPLLIDEGQVVGQALQAQRTGEVYLIDAHTRELYYRGPISDRLDYETSKGQAQHRFLSDKIKKALSHQQAFKKFKEQKTKVFGSRAPAWSFEQKASPGCIIHFPKNKKVVRSDYYTKTIAPIFQNRCVKCHKVNGVAPWAMTSYKKVFGFSPMIKEVLLTKRMPPWFSDPHIGQFKDNLGITDAEKRELIHWVNTGAPRGDGPDPLTKNETEALEWKLGPPDFIITLPKEKLPATGELPYYDYKIKSPLKKDGYLKAVQVKPKHPQSIHHIFMANPHGHGWPKNTAAWGGPNGLISTYAPGIEVNEYPKDSGTHVYSNSHFHFNVHYTPFGKAVTEEVEIGFYLHKEPPKNIHLQTIVRDITVRIPPGKDNHREWTYAVAQYDILLHAITPHAHYLGKSARFYHIDPQGKKTELLNNFRYDFNWQRTYHFKKPHLIKKGSKILAHFVYDNSVNNRRLQKPFKEVRWGLQSDDEMLWTGLRYSRVDKNMFNGIDFTLDEIAFRPYANSAYFAMVDDNLDGVLSKSEFKIMQQIDPGLVYKPLVMIFHQAPLSTLYDLFDKNGNGQITEAEFSKSVTHYKEKFSLKF